MLLRSFTAPRRLGVFAITCCVLLAAVLPLAAHGQGTGWYCVRAKDHAQPRADAAHRMAEEHGGYYIDHRYTDPNASDKVVYLTFDAGYENGNVAKILDTLEREGVSAAFFVLGQLPSAHPDLIRRMAEEGHLVCNHTYTHKNLCGAPSGALTAELRRLEEACATIGVTMSPYYRPPEGCFDAAMLEEAKAAGYKTVFWSFAYADWDNGKQPDPAAAKTKILDNLHNGAVILLHPTSATNAAILGDVIRDMKAMGYRFGTLDELTGGEGS